MLAHRLYLAFLHLLTKCTERDVPQFVWSTALCLVFSRPVGGRDSPPVQCEPPCIRQENKTCCFFSLGIAPKSRCS